MSKTMIKTIITIALPIIILIIIAGVLKNLSDQKETKEYPYKKKELLTKTERTFFMILIEKCKSKNLYAFPKVRMEDYIDVTNKDEKARYRGYIKSRHIDFMIYDEKINLLAGIELDDKSHQTEKAQKTDEFKNNVFKEIKIPLFRVKTGTNYTDEIDKILKELFPEAENIMTRN